MTAARPPAQTFVFADLAGYTALTEAHGDERAADIAGAFSGAVRALLPGYGAEEVKSIGDAMLLRVADAGDALHLAARLVNDIGARDRALGVRVGMHTGTAVPRDGDWFGEGVNIASRVAGLAQAGEVLLTAQTRAAAGVAIGPGDLEGLGSRELKNLSRPVEVLALVPEGRAGAHALPVDPVCRMAVDPEREAGTRIHGGTRYHFCSSGCAAAFDRDPARYVRAARR